MNAKSAANAAIAEICKEVVKVNYKYIPRKLRDQPMNISDILINLPWTFLLG